MQSHKGLKNNRNPAPLIHSKIMMKMKKLLFTMFVALIFTGISAQYIEIKEGTKTMKEGSYNAYTVSLEEITFKAAEDGWKNFMKEYKAKVKHDKKAKLHISDNVQLPSIGSNPVDIYAMITEDERDMVTTVSVWFDTGNGYVNSIDMEAQSESAEKMVSEFSLKVMKIHADEQLKEQEKQLKELENDLKDLDNKNKDLLKNISKAKENILKWEKELEQNEQNQKSKKMDIESQKEKVEKASSKARKYII
jgi:hypothetical protein